MRARPVRTALPVLFLVLASTSGAAAQLRLGAYGGLSRSDVSSEELGTISGSRSGFVGGAFLERGLTDAFGIRVGVQYVQKGFAVEVPVEETGEEFDLEFRVDYVELPLLLTLTIPGSGSVGAVVHAGPVPAFESRCAVAFETQGTSASVDCGAGDGQDLEVQDAVKSFDLGALAGGALTLDVGGARLFAGVNHTWGLTSFIEEEDEGPGAEPGVASDSTHRALAVVAGASFPLD